MPLGAGVGWEVRVLGFRDEVGDLNVTARRSTTPPLLLNASTPSLQTSHIHCFPSGDYKTSLAGCLPSINAILDFPLYSLRQVFLMGRFPRFPAEPPVIVHMEEADCAISIACEEPSSLDRFSWQQVRSAAGAVSESCSGIPGYGGWTPVGSGVGWHVRVFGWREGVGGLNGTVVGGGVDGMARTILVGDS